MYWNRDTDSLNEAVCKGNGAARRCVQLFFDAAGHQTWREVPPPRIDIGAVDSIVIIFVLLVIMYAIRRPIRSLRNA